jgi:hypothetical protein
MLNYEIPPGPLRLCMTLKSRCHFERAGVGIAEEGEREILYVR